LALGSANRLVLYIWRNLMRMFALIVVATLATAAGAQDVPPRQELDASSKRVKELQQERIATLKTVVEMGMKLTTVGHFEIRDVSEARMTLLKAELDAAEKESDRIALYKEALDSLKQYEALAKAAKEAAKATELDKLAIKSRRLEVEIWLEQAKTKTAK
jgi:hypothetical protein